MPLRTALLAAILLGFLGLGLVVWIGLRVPPRPAVAVTVPPPPPVAKILVAARALHAGGLLKYDDIESREVPLTEVPAESRADTPQARAELTGSMIRRALLPRETLLPADLLPPGDHGFLAAVLRPGMRASTIGVDAVSGTAGLIWPGDHVDVLLTQVTEDVTLPAARRASAETVLNDVRVIAIDQQLILGASGSGMEQGTAHTVTLEVTEAQAERAALAARLGRLSLIVRAAGAPPDRPGISPPAIWGGDVSRALNQGRGDGRVMRLYQGSADGKEFRF